jgi:hypothetical protein
MNDGGKAAGLPIVSSYQLQPSHYDFGLPIGDSLIVLRAGLT